MEYRPQAGRTNIIIISVIFFSNLMQFYSNCEVGDDALSKFPKFLYIRFGKIEGQ
jgi:hypothetical protein